MLFGGRDFQECSRVRAEGLLSDTEVNPAGTWIDGGIDASPLNRGSMILKTFFRLHHFLGTYDKKPRLPKGWSARAGRYRWLHFLVDRGSGVHGGLPCSSLPKPGSEGRPEIRADPSHV